MKRILLATVISLLAGCSSVASYYNSKDICQRYGKPEGYQIPAYCGSTVTGTVQAQQIGPNIYRINISR